MASRGRIYKYLAAALLAAFCLAFARTDTTEKSMVRAVLVEPGEMGWTVGLLYQAPEASADSSEVSDGIGFAAAEGPSLERALNNAASLLPLDANFRLCDYLVLMPGSGWQTLAEYESLVLARQCGRTSALLSACDFTCQDISEATEESGDLLTALLQSLKQTQDAAPRLYEARTDAGLLLPPAGHPGRCTHHPAGRMVCLGNRIGGMGCPADSRLSPLDRAGRRICVLDGGTPADASASSAQCSGRGGQLFCGSPGLSDSGG